MVVRIPGPRRRVLVAFAAAGFLVPLLLHETGWLPSLAASIGGRVARNYALFMRAMGLVTCGAIYFMHRQFFRSARVSGAREKAGWIPGLAAFAAGMAANAVFGSWLLEHH